MIYDLLGGIGVLLFLSAYALLQTGRLKLEGVAYSLMNLLGAIGVLVSLTKDWNLSAFVLEAVWALVSIYGLAKALKKRRQSL